MAVLSRRWAVAISFAIVATLGVVASVSSYWANRVLFDTDAWVETVGPIGTDEVVIGALSGLFSEEIIDWLDAENRLESLLPPILAPLAATAAGFIDDAVVDATERFFESEFYENAWLDVNRTAHTAAVAIIRDEVPNVSTEGGVVTVDLIPFLTPVVDDVFGRITAFGERVPDELLNLVEIDETIATVISTYEEEGLPERLGAIEVYSSDRLAAIQTVAATLDRLVWLLPILTIAFAAAAVYFAPLRLRMGAILLGAAALGWFLAWWLIQVLVDSVVLGIDSTTGSEVAAEVFTEITRGLDSLLLTLVGLALIGCGGVFAWGWYTGRDDASGGSSPGAQPGVSGDSSRALPAE